ncbi:MAG: iron-sulfur cluster assembly scaffold protein [Bacteroidia bacterium]|nr:MAG: iron-sulfur cluster assembly scaffold protein [Bacteroidia bacterium]
MSDLRSLYQEVILDHNKNPRNFRVMEDADRSLEGYNPLCGDRYVIYVRMDGDTIEDVSFTGSGCAISKASASVMSALVKKKTKEEALRLFSQFHDLVTGHGVGGNEEGLGKMAVFAGVSEFPARVKCASLAWHTLKAVLERQTTAVSTE